MKALYRQIAGPDAAFSAIPLALLRFVIGNHLRIRSNGHPLTIDLRDNVTSFDLITGRYESDETRIVTRILRTGDRVIDIGANIGYFAVLFASLVGSAGKVMAIEPDPENAALLRKNVSDNGMESIVSVVEGALGSQSTILPLYRNVVGNRGDHHLYESSDVAWRRERARPKIDVVVHRLDDLVERCSRVDFIKMDIQGYEHVALGGMSRTLERFPNALLLTEFWPRGIRMSGGIPGDYLRSLKSLGFQLWEVRPFKLEPVNETKLERRLEKADLHTNLLCSRPGSLQKIEGFEYTR